MSSGYLNFCKKCHDVKMKKYECNHRNKPENIEKQRIFYSKWYKLNGRNRTIKQLDDVNNWHNNNPEKVNAHRILRKNIKLGKINIPVRCTICSSESKLSGHHCDYSKPLDVIWVCYSCHKKIHYGKISIDVI
jgi:hypothetical protein